MVPRLLARRNNKRREGVTPVGSRQEEREITPRPGVVGVEERASPMGRSLMAVSDVVGVINVVDHVLFVWMAT